MNNKNYEYGPGAPRRATGGARSLIKRCHSAAVCKFTTNTYETAAEQAPILLAPENRGATPQRFKSFFCEPRKRPQRERYFETRRKIGVIPRRGTTSEENHVNGARGAQVSDLSKNRPGPGATQRDKVIFLFSCSNQSRRRPHGA